MKMTIFTDASVTPELKIGGYAFYIGCTKGMIKKAGVLKTPCETSAHGELYSVANALHTLKYCRFKPVTSVVIYTDYLRTVEILNNDTISFRDKSLRNIIEEINFLMLEICIQENINIRKLRQVFNFLHVKAHTGNRDKLSIINNWCDKEASKYRKLAMPKKPKKK